MRFAALILATALICFAETLTAQESSSVSDKIANFPGKFISKLSSKADLLTKQLDKQTAIYLDKLARQESKLKKRISKPDSNSSKKLFAGDPQKQYAQWLQMLNKDSIPPDKTKVPSGEYYPYIDSLQTAMAFLKQHPELINTSGLGLGDLQQTINKLGLLQAKMQDADQIKQFIQQRKEQLRQYFINNTHIPSGALNAYNEYNRQAYYYKQQVADYKEVLNDPDRMMKTALGLLNRIPAFTNFMKSNSMLASLFNLPGAYNPSQLNQGMPTRDQVVAAFQSQMGPGGPNLSSVIQQNVQSGQGQASALSDKLTSLRSGGGSELDMPNFTPNTQKTKSFLQRIDYGINLQTAKSNHFYPTTSDLALSLGYKISDGNIAGVAASYKIGWGQDIGHINLSSQGISLRSFLDIKIKKSLYASGGFEYNYQHPFTSPNEIRNLSSWQKSGLIGLSKVVSLKTKVFKSTKLQLLWDFLSYQQIPQAQPFKFRVGYSF